MKKTIKGIIAGVVLTGGLAFGFAQIEKLSYYEMSGFIVDVDEEGVYTVELANGYLYDFDGYGFEKHDQVRVEMKNVGDDMNCYNDELMEVWMLGE